MNSIRFVVIPADINSYVVADTLSNSEFCVCQECAGALDARRRAKYIADTLNRQWQLDRSVLTKAFGTYLG